jgi:hypothetical protein
MPPLTVQCVRAWLPTPTVCCGTLSVKDWIRLASCQEPGFIVCFEAMAVKYLIWRSLRARAECCSHLPVAGGRAVRESG